VALPPEAGAPAHPTDPSLVLTVVRRTKEEAAATRELLLDTAEAVFLERGVSRASLQDIAAAAGLTRGAIYWHFKDKAELFIAMMDRVCLPCEAACAVPPDDSAALVALRRLALQPLEQVRDDVRTRRVFTIAIHRTEYSSELQMLRQRHQDAIAEYTRELAQLLLAAVRAGQLRADLDTETAALVVFSMVDGLLTRCTLDMAPSQCVHTAEAGLALLLAGMGAP
jgi:TetR/AcrR family acrAB operon transcriptional repressor